MQPEPMRGLILMTALVPTIGHEYLIKFASEFVGKSGRLDVIISTRSFEPTDFAFRARGLGFPNQSNIYYHEHRDDDAPQNPPLIETEKFWNYWIDVVMLKVAAFPTHVFASEPYGERLAEAIEADFIPVDLSRSTYPVKGSDVRNDILTSSKFLTAGSRQQLRKHIVLFGQESVGKTSISKSLAERHDGVWFPEWARPYLEYVGPDLDLYKMETIFRSQTAVDKVALESDTGKLLHVQDTDIMSTIGYFRFLGWDINPELDAPVPGDVNLKKKHYYLLSDKHAPFHADQLRYGGDVRETKMEFWARLLEEYGLSYTVVEEKRIEDAVYKIKDHLVNVHRYNYPPRRTLGEISSFKRN